jgi:hypothetical protein
VIWEQELTNGVAPVDVLVSDSGNYVVTLDNWHEVDRGDNVVAIYGPESKLVRQLALSDFLTQQQNNQLPVSVSSTWWGTGHYLDEKQKCLVLRVAQNHDWMVPGKTPQFQEVRIRLATGEVLPASTGSLYLSCWRLVASRCSWLIHGNRACAVAPRHANLRCNPSLGRLTGAPAWARRQDPARLAMLTRLYQDLLGRQPEGGAVDFWTAQMNQGTTPACQPGQGNGI